MSSQRRAFLGGFATLFFAAGCLGSGRLPVPFGLRVVNDYSGTRRLTVEIDRIGSGTVYSERLIVAGGGVELAEAVAETDGRYRIRVEDHTAAEKKQAERDVELGLTVGHDDDPDTEFCGWFLVRTDSEGLAVSVPRCYPAQTDDESSEDE